MNKTSKMRLRLIILAREYKRSARQLRRDGYEDGYNQLKAVAEAYQYSAWIIKIMS